MYSSFYGLTFNPFDKQQLKEKDHFISRDFTEMINRLNYLKDIRGIGVFTARPGMGKSYALRCFAASLNPSLFHMEYLCLSTISVADFYKQLCFILGVPEKGGKTGMFKAIQEQITYLYKEKRQPLLLAIDEAQYLNTGILNDIKMLMNSGYDNVPPSREKSAVNPGTAQSGRRIWKKYRAVCAYRNVPPDITIISVRSLKLSMILAIDFETPFST